MYCTLKIPMSNSQKQREFHVPTSVKANLMGKINRQTDRQCSTVQYNQLQ